MKKVIVSLVLILIFCFGLNAAPSLKQRQLLAIVGDSITEEKGYSKLIETYITCCYPELKARFLLMGWASEKAAGFDKRMDNDLLPFKPDVATVCYGMNDGKYRKYEQGIGEDYESSLNSIVSRLKQNNTLVLVGSPGAVDTYYYDKKKKKYGSEVYNETLGKLAEIAGKVAKNNQMLYVEIHEPLMTVMAKAKRSYGEAFAVCGTDGIHPGANGHVVMAQCFLKGLGFDGNIGTITVDMKGKTEANAGHKVLSAQAGKIEVESSRYPFCFFGEEKDTEQTASILPFVTFNEELNRLTLIVANFEGVKAKVKWGEDSKTFTKEQLEKGVNLAAEFRNNPFSKPFSAVEAVILEKQTLETEMIKKYITKIPEMIKELKKDESNKAIMEKKKKLLKDREKLMQKIEETFIPVKHVIEIVKE